MNETIDSTIKECSALINSDKYKNIVCSVSGGGDSDIIVDLISKVDKNKKVKYLFLDTGVEYQATYDHINYLEQKYDIKINRIKNEKTAIPLVLKKHGLPFLSKQASEYIQQLQKHNFEWDDTEDYIYLIKKYCKCYDEPIGNKYIKLSDGKYYKGCVGAILWWCNFSGTTEWGLERSGSVSYCINRNKYLKEFLIKNPPTFRISKNCCDTAKKNVSHRVLKVNKCDMLIMGMRKSEGGIRSIVYNCTFNPSKKENKYDTFLPIFFWTNDIKKEYEKENNIVHSKCYTEYGFTRTGCVCCPYGKNFEFELEQIQKYEPKLYKLCMNIFKDSYDYTRKYNEFKAKRKFEDKNKNLMLE